MENMIQMKKEITEGIDRQLANIRQLITGREFDNIYFIGCGGALAYMEPSKFAVDMDAQKLLAYSRTAAELMAINPRSLGERSIAVVSSYGGNMLEAVQALRWAKEKGAFTIGTTYNPESIMATESDAPMVFQFADDYSNHPYTCQFSAMLLITYTILDVLEGNRKIDRLPQNLYNLEHVYKKAIDMYSAKVPEFVSRFKDADIIYNMGSGVNYINAYIFATCLLLEMQWINAASINAAEFFHGALEIVDKDSNFIMLMGLGETRAIDERALSFLDRFTAGTFVIDSKDFEMEGWIDEDFQSFMAQITTNRLLRMFVTALAEARHHSLSRRRYYCRMEY